MLTTRPGAVPDMTDASAEQMLALLEGELASYGAVVVAYSGGADSSLLAFVARQVLGTRVVAVTADSPSMPRHELAAARDFCVRFDITHVVVPTNELEDPRYRSNTRNRCYFCKSALMDVVVPIAREQGATILLGAIVDDLGDFRPGQAAAARSGAEFPLIRCGIGKSSVRSISQLLGLPTWDKPAAACLASRLVTGVPVTADALLRVEAAESYLRLLGMTGRLRVRDHGGDLARIEVEDDDFQVAISNRQRIHEHLRSLGFRYVTMDLLGYRQGGAAISTFVEISRGPAAP